jgi:hypothetical protein
MTELSMPNNVYITGWVSVDDAGQDLQLDWANRATVTGTFIIILQNDCMGFYTCLSVKSPEMKRRW